MPNVNLANAKWFIQQDVKKREVTSGTESTVIQTIYDSSVLIKNTSGNWKGKISKSN